VRDIHGALRTGRLGGFDVIKMAQDSVFEYTHSEADKLNILYRKMIEAAAGIQYGKGFYDYLPDGTKKPSRFSDRSVKSRGQDGRFPDRRRNGGR
jgi:3-hydroxyacyl-CoA dehydrogenase